ncbi:hypothetical protein IK146_02830 [Candidatus Saccharibacteria bacterium]|nr:hypothetical protein [Candidatus Saccharibacteria bacterium]
MIDFSSKIVHRLINLTGDTIWMYDTEGEVKEIEPASSGNIPLCLAEDTAVIAKSRYAADKLQIDPKYIAVIQQTGTGNGGKQVSRLVRPYDNRTIYYSPNTFC